MKERNTGISLLRLFMSFIVIQNHFDINGETFLQRFIMSFYNLAVPCFMFVSFYLMADRFVSDRVDGGFIANRYKRTFYPLIGWGLIYWVAMSILHRTFIDWKELFYQVITGCSGLLDPPLWFLTSQIIIFTLLFVIYNCFSNVKNRNIALGVAIVFAFICQYSGIHFYLNDTAPYEIRYTLGRAWESIPIAFSGILFAQCRPKIKRKGILITACITVYLLLQFFIPDISCDGYGYQGMNLYLKAMAFCIVMVLLPKISSEKVSSVINSCAKYTMGIYCMHWAAGNYLMAIGDKLEIGFGQGTLIFITLIYFLCLLAAAMIDRVAGKYEFISKMVA